MNRLKRTSVAVAVVGAVALGAVVLLGTVTRGQETPGREPDVWSELQGYVDAGRLSESVVLFLRESGVGEGLVALDDSEVQADAARRRAARGLQENDAMTIMENGKMYAAIKDRVLRAAGDGIVVLEEYPLLPVLLLRFERAEALAALLRQPEVRAVQENRADPPAGTS